MGLIKETNEQYYSGTQKFLSQGGSNTQYTTTFNTDLILGSYDPYEEDYTLNNFKIYLAPVGTEDFEEYTGEITLSGNTITVVDALNANDWVLIQLKRVNGGVFGLEDAFGTTVEENQGQYAYTSLDDIINNFEIIYTGAGKLIPHCKRTDIIFHAKRGLQEFSYDVLKSIKSQELTVPPSLSLAIPQDYVNYTKISYIDLSGVKKPLYPVNNLTKIADQNPIQDMDGTPMHDNFGRNIEGSSITEERWAAKDYSHNKPNYGNEDTDGWMELSMGQRYGNDPTTQQSNGWFDINLNKGTISFSSNCANKIIILEYISDGLAYDRDTKIPKLAEEALYAHIIHAIISTRANQPEYVVRRLKQERSAKLRNAKLRLSNIKLGEIIQVMRGKSQWIKH